MELSFPRTFALRIEVRESESTTGSYAIRISNMSKVQTCCITSQRIAFSGHVAFLLRCADKRRMSSTLSALSSVARLSIGMTMSVWRQRVLHGVIITAPHHNMMTMSVSSQLCLDVDAASATRIPFSASSTAYPPRPAALQSSSDQRTRVNAVSVTYNANCRVFERTQRLKQWT